MRPQSVDQDFPTLDTITKSGKEPGFAGSIGMIDGK
jgi:hypothetical protein